MDCAAPHTFEGENGLNRVNVICWELLILYGMTISAFPKFEFKIDEIFGTIRIFWLHNVRTIHFTAAACLPLAEAVKETEAN